MADAPVIDPEALNALRSLNPDDGDAFLKEIIAIFLEDTPKRIAELESSVAAGDAPTFTRAAHSIKGSSANLGAVSLRAVSEKLERMAKKEGLTEAAGLVEEVKAEFARADSELRKLLT